jgi:undecaprenyl phosphate-alpha-L-ara4N flippase subunit ArnF
MFMSSITLGFGFITITALVVIAGDFFLKLAADRGLTALSALVVMGIVLYAISAVLWFGAMRHLTLGQAGVAYSMLTLVALALIGAMVFGERLGLRECAGIGCALTAMVLMVRAE